MLRTARSSGLLLPLFALTAWACASSVSTAPAPASASAATKQDLDAAEAGSGSKSGSETGSGTGLETGLETGPGVPPPGAMVAISDDRYGGYKYAPDAPHIGDLAPAIEATLADGSAFVLSEALASQRVLLLFYRGDW